MDYICESTIVVPTTKHCPKCGDDKDAVDFYINKRASSGLSSSCKKCKTVVDRLYYKNNKTEILRKTHEYCRTVEGKKRRREIEIKYSKTKKGKRNKRKNAKMWRLKCPEKAKARDCVSNAIRSGHLIKQPCEVCGGLKVQAHHEDYSKPLDVNWLCIKHHNKLRSYSGKNKKAL